MIIIRPGFYYVDKQIIITFQFSTVPVDVYDLFRLSVVPSKDKQALIPSYPFIATYENVFMYMEAECRSSVTTTSAIKEPTFNSGLPQTADTN